MDKENRGSKIARDFAFGIVYGWDKDPETYNIDDHKMDPYYQDFFDNAIKLENENNLHKDNNNNMNFSDALNEIKAGKKVSREGWNGKGMFIFLVNGSTFTVNRPPLLGIYPEGTQIKYHAHVDMKTADGQVVPWLCSQTDMLADDWGVVE